MAKSKARPYAVILPLEVAHDGDLRARLLTLLAARLHDVVEVGATPQNTVLTWSAFRFAGPGLDELEAPWKPGGPLPEWAGYLRLTVTRR